MEPFEPKVLKELSEKEEIKAKYAVVLNKIKSKKNLLEKELGVKGKIDLATIQQIVRLSKIGDIQKNFEEFLIALKKSIHIAEVLSENGLGIDKTQSSDDLHKKVMELEPANFEEYLDAVNDAFWEINEQLREKEFNPGQKNVIFLADKTVEKLKKRNFKLESGPVNYRSSFKRINDQCKWETIILDLYIVDAGMQQAIVRQLLFENEPFQLDLIKDYSRRYTDARGLGSGIEERDRYRYTASLMESWKRYKEQVEGNK